MSEEDISKVLVFKLLIVLILIVVVPIVAISGIQTNVQAELKSWPTTQGIVKESEVKYIPGTQDPETGYSSDPSYEPIILYEYAVNGKNIISNSISIFGKSFDTRAECEQFLSNYAIGSTVIVYYNPDNPNISFIYTDQNSDSRNLHYYPIIFAVITLLLVILPNYRFLKTQIKTIMLGRSYRTQLYKLNLNKNEKNTLRKPMSAKVVDALLSETERKEISDFFDNTFTRLLAVLFVYSSLSILIYELRLRINILIIFFEITQLNSIITSKGIVLNLLISLLLLFLIFQFLFVRYYSELDKEILSLSFWPFIGALLLVYIVLGVTFIMVAISVGSFIPNLSVDLQNYFPSLLNQMTAFNLDVPKFLVIIVILATFSFLLSTNNAGSQGQKQHFMVHYVKYLVTYPLLLLTMIIIIFSVPVFIIVIGFLSVSMLIILASFLYLIPYITYYIIFQVPPVNITAKYMFLSCLLIAFVGIVTLTRKIHYYRQLGKYIEVNHIQKLSNNRLY